MRVQYLALRAENPSKPEPSEPSGEFTNIPPTTKKDRPDPQRIYGGCILPATTHQTIGLEVAQPQAETVATTPFYYSTELCPMPIFTHSIAIVWEVLTEMKTGNMTLRYRPKYQMNLTKSYVSGYSEGICSVVPTSLI